MTIPSMISESDYCAIEDALQSSEKGRRFLRAYADRSRSFESRRLLRSISRLHRAALGGPGLNAEAHRDLASVLKSVAKHKQIASQCGEAGTRAAILAASLEEVEACLITLIEAVEERAFDTLNCGVPGAGLGEPSPHFLNEPR
jgi:hypothetical protein